jgi:hypothetical protein
MPISYILPRLVRHFLPDGAVRFLLRRRLVIRPGLETTDPQQAFSHYLQALQHAGISLQGKRVLVLGYGGRFAVGCALLEAGAGQVLLVDPFAPPDHRANQHLLPHFSRYVMQSGEQVIPYSSQLRLLPEDIRSLAGRLEKVDVVLSNSVFEHLDDVEGITHALAQCTQPHGFHLHFIDLRDHFFRYPFEMLTFSEKTWKNWLNPTSNLNRLRLGHYRQAFERCFQQVNITILAKDLQAWEKASRRVRKEFISGDMDEDAAVQLQVTLSTPLI